MDGHTIYSQESQVPYSALDTYGHIKIDALLTLFQDAASLQCKSLGISGYDLSPKGLKWVVSRYQVTIHQSPEWAAPFVLNTWRAPWKNLYELRNFTISTPDGGPLVTALGIWIMINAKNSKPVRLSPHLPKALMEPTAAPPDLWESGSALEAFDRQVRFKTRYQDLDLNGHINNTVYVKWAVEALPEPYISRFVPQRAVIRYLKESFHPDIVISQVNITVQESRLTSHHAILREENHEALCELTLTWKKV